MAGDRELIAVVDEHPEGDHIVYDREYEGDNEIGREGDQRHAAGRPLLSAAEIDGCLHPTRR